MPHPRAPKSRRREPRNPRDLIYKLAEGQARRALFARDYSQVDDRPSAIHERCRTSATLLSIKLRTRIAGSDPEPHHAVRGRDQGGVSHLHRKNPCAVDHIIRCAWAHRYRPRPKGRSNRARPCTFTSETASHGDRERRHDSCGVQSRTRYSDSSAGNVRFAGHRGGKNTRAHLNAP